MPETFAGRETRPRKPWTDRYEGKGRTQQNFKDECDINRIMAKYIKTGELSHLAKHEPQYGDFSSGVAYQEASNRVLAAQADFDALSANIRKRMDNDPAKLLAFVGDPENLEEARALGLVPEKDPEPGPIVVQLAEGAAASEGESPLPSKAESTETPGA